MLERLQAVAKLLKQEMNVYRLVLQDRRTPRIAKITLGLAVGYALLPFDLIPDWIPVLGLLDDLLIVPTLLIIALQFIPENILLDCRERVQSGKLT